MAERVVVDPITRIEGHLRIELEADGGKISNAWSETTQFRGIEEIVKGRDPRDVWAFVGRICGVCTGTHSAASVAAVEDALGITVPTQGQRIREILLAAQEAHDHVVHFYHLHALDFVNVAKVVEADPQKAVDFAHSIGSTWKGNTVEKFQQVKDTVQQILDSGQLSVFTGGYWDHPDYRLPPEANLMAVSHYLDALQFQRSIIRIVTVFGGKNPHPNFLVGGMAVSIDPDKSETFNQVSLDQITVWAKEIQEFVHSCYYPDAVAIMSVYKDYFDIGQSSPSFLAVGMAGATYSGYPDQSRVETIEPSVKPAVILDGDYDTLHPFDPDKIAEFITSAWYTYEGGDDAGLKPSEGETTVKYTGPQPPYEWLADDPKYTWSKAPRYDGRPVQMGPLARVLIAYKQNHPQTVKLVNEAAEKLGITVPQLNSTGGRTFARAVEAVTGADYLVDVLLPAFVDGITSGDIDVFDGSKWEPSTWPKDTQGVAFEEVARGMLSHWVHIKDGKVANYQAVVPTTWLGSGRGPGGDKDKSPFEEALSGTGQHPLQRSDQPLEILRTIHSFDPCMACAVHITDPENEALEPFTVVTG